MKLSTREDILAPPERVYAEAADFERIEAQLRSRGVDIVRETEGPVGPGTEWRVRYTWRDRPLETRAELISVDPGKGYALKSMTGGVEGMAVVDLAEVAEGRTRIFASLDLRPTTLSSRLLLQTVKLAKGRLSERFAARVARFAAATQEAYEAERGA